MEKKNFNKGKINNNLFRYVDLGLPSGTLWATCNVGAKKPSDCGKFFQWGDTKGYTKSQVGKDKQFTWSDYKFGTSPNFTKYTTTGATLELEDDAAHVHMGGDWHMPTPTQIQELLNNTTNTWTTQDGVNGRLFTSKKDGSKSIFIPAAGNAWDGSVRSSGGSGGVWSSMLSMEYVDYGQRLFFYQEDAFVAHSFRQIGLPIRGVIDKKNDNFKGNKSNKNDELNLVEILKNVPKGTKLWSPICGELELLDVYDTDKTFPIVCVGIDDGLEWSFKADGAYTENTGVECLLFPSKDNRDWKTFNVAKKHKHFEPFQKILFVILNEHNEKVWASSFYSYYDKSRKRHYLVGGIARNES